MFHLSFFIWKHLLLELKSSSVFWQHKVKLHYLIFGNNTLICTCDVRNTLLSSKVLLICPLLWLLRLTCTFTLKKPLEFLSSFTSTCNQHIWHRYWSPLAMPLHGRCKQNIYFQNNCRVLKEMIYISLNSLCSF